MWISDQQKPPWKSKSNNLVQDLISGNNKKLNLKCRNIMSEKFESRGSSKFIQTNYRMQSTSLNVTTSKLPSREPNAES